ncbi:MAG: hypothetical protein VX252_05405 [Myxococcota bacterium]|nr:hypothetical protein [Myxococcota bacterium]
MQDDPLDRGVMHGEAWQRLCETLMTSSARVLADGVPDSPRHRAEGFRYLSRFLAAGIVSCVAHNDADYPVFGRMMDYTMPWGLDNPDCLYLYAPLRGGAEYRVFGHRGSACHIDFQVNFGHFANGDVSSWGTVSSLDGLELETTDSGEFELVIGGEPREGNWIASRDDVEFLLVRQYFDDWEKERPADLLIEREGATYPAPPPRTDQVSARLDQLSRWIDRGGQLWEQMSRGFLSMPPNSLLIHRPDDSGERAGLRGLAYGMGHFACDEDEAVILEFSPPKCLYWGLALANYYWECVEFATRSSSITRAQSVLSSDGLVRVVIAHRDPGVPNWLDPGHNEEGTLTARFLHGDQSPEVRFQRVPFSKLRECLPADTPRVESLERSKSLEARRRAAIRRYRM